MNGYLKSYNATNGQTNWRVKTPGSTGPVLGDGPAYDNGRLFLVSPSGGLGDDMPAYDARSGGLAWSTHLPYQYGFSSPVSAGDASAYVAGAGSGGKLYSVREGIVRRPAYDLQTERTQCSLVFKRLMKKRTRLYTIWGRSGRDLRHFGLLLGRFDRVLGR